jgi:hypothetical protein
MSNKKYNFHVGSIKTHILIVIFLSVLSFISCVFYGNRDEITIFFSIIRNNISVSSSGRAVAICPLEETHKFLSPVRLIDMQ